MGSKASCLDYDFRYFGGVFVSTGDVNGDGLVDIVTGTNGNGGPEVKAFSGVNVLTSPTPTIVDDFFAYDPAFSGGARVAVMDVNGDGQADAITGVGPGAWEQEMIDTPPATAILLAVGVLLGAPAIPSVAQDKKPDLPFTPAQLAERALHRVGPEDENKGQAAKYLLLPPGFSAIPAGSTEADVAAALALVKMLRAYPLAQATDPPEERFVDIHDKTFEGVPAFDESFFASLNRMVQEEPVQQRDFVAMGMLRSIGIEKGKEFKPDAATRRIFKAAAQEQLAMFVEGMKTFGQQWWDDRRWKLPDTRGVKTNFSYVTDTAVDVDARGLSNFAAFGFPKRVGRGGSIVYIIAFHDGGGKSIRGENTYKLHVPPNVPAKQYWSVIAYDSLTNAFIRESPVVGLDSYSRTMKRNADGSVDIYFGPSAPAGQDANWVYTAPGRGWFAGFRLYDPDKPFFDKAWKLPDIEKMN
jgi:Protein of unknown function (DUF1214)/FG-GAP-like repeat